METISSFISIPLSISDVVRDAFKRVNLGVEEVERMKDLPRGIEAEKLGMEIMVTAGIPFFMAKIAMYGMKSGKYGGSSGYDKMYGSHALAHAIGLADAWVMKTPVDAGMKGAEFRKEKLIEFYGLKERELLEPAFSWKYSKPEQKTFYRLWYGEDKKAIFSFEPNRIGVGGYGGAIFQNFDDVIEFAKWFFKHSKTYNDFELFQNGLGGVASYNFTPEMLNSGIERYRVLTLPINKSLIGATFEPGKPFIIVD